MPDDLWDVVVLGAGPAGCLAARQLALTQLRVLLVERRRLPRFKVCGGCLGGAALDLLTQLGLGHLPSRCGGVTLQRMRLASGGKTAEFPIGKRVAVCRKEFDHLLAQEAVQAGATLHDETVGVLLPAASSTCRSVQLQQTHFQQTVRTRAVIMATGLAPSAPDCSTTIAANSFIGLSTTVESSDRFADCPLLQMACSNDGYVGLAPLGGGRLDIAAALNPRSLARTKSPPQLVERILIESGIAPLHGLEKAAWRGTPALTQQTRPLATHRCILIGDAAGYVEPFTGEGIGWAMQSALDAAGFVLVQLDHWNSRAVQRWARDYAAALRRRQLHCRAVTALLRHSAVRTIAIHALNVAPGLARPIVNRLDHPLQRSHSFASRFAYGG
jgi:flavin-dependent dehydrogenase